MAVQHLKVRPQGFDADRETYLLVGRNPSELCRTLVRVISTEWSMKYFLLMYEKVYADQHNECCGGGASEVKRD
jgi:hypothetical protein